VQTLTESPIRLPRIREGLKIQAISPTEYVVKRRDNRQYFSIGPLEAFLLEQLIERSSPEEIKAAYAERFQDQLSDADLKEFIGAIRPMGLLQPSASKTASKKTADNPSSAEGTLANQDVDADGTEPEETKPRSRFSLRDQSALFFRVPLCDPDEFPGRLVSKVPFLWTRYFLVFSACVMLAALSVMVSSRSELALGISNGSGWSRAALFILVMLACTSLHEVAHGATLRHFGGEVHDSGLLFMFFTPCMYCNVSDAWLIPDK